MCAKEASVGIVNPFARSTAANPIAASSSISFFRSRVLSVISRVIGGRIDVESSSMERSVGCPE
jgi:hypothetical protein